MAIKRTVVHIPQSFFKVQREKQKPTVFIQRSGGFMGGRRNVSSERSDGTKVARMTKDFDVNKDGKIDDRDLRKGEIIGRVPSHMRRTGKGLTVVREYDRD